MPEKGVWHFTRRQTKHKRTWLVTSVAQSITYHKAGFLAGKTFDLVRTKTRWKSGLLSK